MGWVVRRSFRGGTESTLASQRNSREVPSRRFLCWKGRCVASSPKSEGSLGSLVLPRTLQEPWASSLLSHCTQPSLPMKPVWLTHVTHGLSQRLYMIREPMCFHVWDRISSSDFVSLLRGSSCFSV